jgi:RNA polymerase sigma factor (sigma-70 family)
MTMTPTSTEFFDDELPPSNCTDLIYWRAVILGGRAREWGCTQLLLRYETALTKRLKERQIPQSEFTDIIHEIFIKMIHGSESFRNSEKRFVDWFFAIAQNTTTDYMRKKIVVQKREDNLNSYIEKVVETDSFAESTKIHTIALQNCVQSSLDEFEKAHPKHAQILRRAILEDLGHKELAKILNKEPGNAREYLSQCRKKFKPFVDHCKIYLDEDEL